MDPKHVERLKHQQELAIQETEERINQLQKFKEDYEKLHKRLETLPDEVSYDIMVPIGSKAFMPGKLVHTNEVLVLLGDNWFAERSAKQAAEIVTRRITGVENQIKELEKQKGLIEPRVQFTEEIQRASKEVVEIREEYDEESEKKWREEHRKNVRKAYQAHRNVLSSKAEARKEDKSASDAELWARLDELEKLEAEHRELETVECDEANEEESSGEEEDEEDADEDKHVRWKDEHSHQRPSSLRTRSTINFTHTHTELKDTMQESEDYQNTSNPPSITSPSDIYKYFYTPTSILKSPSSSATSSHETTSRPVIPSIQKPFNSGPQAFTGEIHERKDTETLVIEPSAASSEPPRRVSKFKAQRMKKSS